MVADGHAWAFVRDSRDYVEEEREAAAVLAGIHGHTCQPASLGPVKFERDDPLYVSTLRTTRCDASGSFSFTLVADGVWYLTSSVKWQGASQIEGGSMMQRVDVRGGRLVKVSLP
jgi:hypothetical protein